LSFQIPSRFLSKLADWTIYSL